jgi:hypothetical protein
LSHAIIASLVASRTINEAGRQVFFTATIIKIVNDHPNTRINDLMPPLFAFQTAPKVFA